MLLRFYEDGLAQASYLLACERTRQACVIDPRRDVDIYVEAARPLGLTLAWAIETHIHADFVSGARELARTGAVVMSGPGSALQFDSHEAADEDVIAMGDVRLRFLHTPGHTPEHICVHVETPDQPVRLFTGDTLFVGGVGRPDLLGDVLTRRLAGELYDSLFRRILALGDDVEIHPGHGAGSLCGAGIGTEPFSLLAQERRFNRMLQHQSKDTFVAAVLADLPETPPYFPRMKRVNHEGPRVLGLSEGYDGPAPLGASEAAAAVDAGAWLIDLRSSADFGAAHPSGAVNITCGSKVGYWAGWVIPAGTPVVLLAAKPGDTRTAARQLLRVGADRIEGFVDGGFDAWRAAGLPVASIPQMSIQELDERLTRGERLTVLDVRNAKEWNDGHIEGATHVPVGDVPGRASELAGSTPIATLCEGGFRSSLASSLLVRAGIPNVINVRGGMGAVRESKKKG